uniref:SANT domain-containing protein n=1 Tax=Timspurckia oligopyrenoides TaxID=708627 RepID=A0A7S0ZK15_9RHOD|mmetsp:Transcript_8309/g.15045  ORF Transcript_8309/g.15045 Transcript_8309/m.15045 type:complete len:400 (+) Transcript_8309:43-1242(+)
MERQGRVWNGVDKNHKNEAKKMELIAASIRSKDLATFVSLLSSVPLCHFAGARVMKHILGFENSGSKVKVISVEMEREKSKSSAASEVQTELTRWIQSNGIHESEEKWRSSGKRKRAKDEQDLNGSTRRGLRVMELSNVEDEQFIQRGSKSSAPRIGFKYQASVEPWRGGPQGHNLSIHSTRIWSPHCVDESELEKRCARWNLVFSQSSGSSTMRPLELFHVLSLIYLTPKTKHGKENQLLSGSEQQFASELQSRMLGEGRLLSDEEKYSFVHGIRMYGKDFRAISKAGTPDRPVKELILYYYQRFKQESAIRRGAQTGWEWELDSKPSRSVQSKDDVNRDHGMKWAYVCSSKRDALHRLAICSNDGFNPEAVMDKDAMLYMRELRAGREIKAAHAKIK